MPLTLTPIYGLPVFKPGDNISQEILSSLESNHITLEDQDILVIAQKIISKVEGRFVDLNTIKPSALAVAYASICQKDPRFVELILQESKAIIRVKRDVLIVEHRLGFICANAGIDHSNVSYKNLDPDLVLLLPEDPDLSASEIRKNIKNNSGKMVGVMIIDSHGRAWRMGTVGVSIGLSGIPGLQDLRGKPDLFEYPLQITQVGVADELAAAASLTMGQASEGTPVVHVRGFPYPLRESSIGEVIRPKNQDLFR